MNRNLIITMFLFTLILPLVSAGDIGVQNKQMTLWADSLTATGYYATTSANITVYNSAKQIVVNNQTMTQLSTGLFYYNFTPNTTGQFYTNTIYFNTTAPIAIATSTFYVEVNADMMLAIIFGLVAVLAFFSVLGYRLSTATIVAPEKGELKIQDLGAVLILFGFVIVDVILYVIDSFAVGQTYAGTTSAMYYAGIWITIIAASLYILLYTIYRLGIYGMASKMHRGNK